MPIYQYTQTYMLYDFAVCTAVQMGLSPSLQPGVEQQSVSSLRAPTISRDSTALPLLSRRAQTRRRQRQPIKAKKSYENSPHRNLCRQEHEATCNPLLGVFLSKERMTSAVEQQQQQK